LEAICRETTVYEAPVSNTIYVCTVRFSVTGTRTIAPFM